MLTRRTFIRSTGATGLILGTSGLATPALAQGAKIKIGYVSPQTGPLASFAESDAFNIQSFLGTEAGANFEVIVKDSQSNPNRAAEVAKELISRDEVNLILVASIYFLLRNVVLRPMHQLQNALVALNAGDADLSMRIAPAKVNEIDAVIDSFTMPDWYTLNARDHDYGSSSPVVFQYGDRALVATSSKSGIIYLSDAVNLGGRDHQSTLYTSPRFSNDADVFERDAIPVPKGPIDTW